MGCILLLCAACFAIRSTYSMSWTGVPVYRIVFCLARRGLRIIGRSVGVTVMSPCSWMLDCETSGGRMSAAWWVGRSCDCVNGRRGRSIKTLSPEGHNVFCCEYIYEDMLCLSSTVL